MLQAYSNWVPHCLCFGVLCILTQQKQQQKHKYIVSGIQQLGATYCLCFGVLCILRQHKQQQKHNQRASGIQ